MTYDRVVYETASTKCKDNGGTLAMPKTKDVNDFLIQEIRSFGGIWQPMWIGMNDKDVEGKIVWEDGTDVNAWGNFDWTNGGLFGSAENCFALDPTNGKWHDYGCSNTGLLTTIRITGNAKLPFICQYPVRKEQDAVDQIDQVDQGDKADQGDQGDKADQGDQGVKADQGDQGDKADQGDQGVKADQGDQGDKADQGDQGVKADQGDQGDKADQGDQGVKADQGDQGVKADQGDQGVKADQGDQGVKADQGDQGVKADQGGQGVKADQGDQRDRGQDSVDDSQDDTVDDDNCPPFNCPDKDCGMNGFKMDNGCQICECED